MNPLTEKEALSKAAAFCSAAERCRAEVSEKLQKWGIEDEALSRILQHLEAERYIDEERYCQAFVRDKFRFSHWGKLKIKEALYQKGISSLVAWRHLNEIEEAEYLEALRGLIGSKRRSIRAKNDYELSAKLVRFAMSRGFELKDIRLCLQFSEDE